MPLAVTLRLDEQCGAEVETMRRALAATGADTSIERDYAPHITLGIFKDDAPEERLRAAVRAAAESRTPITVTLASLGLFPTAPAVLFLAPVVEAALLELHAAMHDATGDLPCHDHYRRGAWVPHVTLDQDVRDAAAALAALDLSRMPITATAGALDLVRFKPVRVLATYILSR